MMREPRDPGPGASEADYRQWLKDCADWQKAKGARHLRAVQADEQPTPDAIPLEAEFTSEDMETWWLPEPVGLWVEACHSALGVPKAMAIAAALCAAACVTQGKAVVRIKPGWDEPLCLFWLVFSPTGSRKSALLRKATAPIRAMQAAKVQELEPVIRARNRERFRIEAQITRLQRSARADSYSEHAQEVRDQVKDYVRQLEENPVPIIPRWLYDDINPTVVPRKLRHNQEAEGIARLAVLDAEGTFLSNLLGRHSGTVNVDPLLKGYAAEPIDMVRTVHGQEGTADTHIDSAHLTLLLLVQPHLLDDIRAKPELGSNGLLGRCLMTHLKADSRPLPFNAPDVPQDVQDGYGRWLATLAAIEPGAAYQMPAGCLPELERLHNQLEADRLEGKGAVGWTVRTLGRICRIVALTELVELSNGVELSHGPRGVRACVKVISKIQYLFSSLYSAGLAHSRVLEPSPDPVAALTRRALGWLRQSPGVTVGKTVTLRFLIRGLRLKKDTVTAICDSLVSTGHLEMAGETRRGNQTLTVSYTILSLDPDGSRPAPSPEPEPDYGPEPEQDHEEAPPASDYMEGE